MVSLLLADPRVDPDEAIENGITALSMACQNGHQSVVSLLLADPRVDPNKPPKDGATPFSIACQQGHQSLVSLLLADPRVDPSKPTNDNTTPLWYASQNGHLGVVQVMLASGREIDTTTRSSFNNRTAAEQGRAMDKERRESTTPTKCTTEKKTNGPKCADLLDAYEKDPVAVRQRLRYLPIIRETYIGWMFALVVFFSDGFLELPKSPLNGETRRFFAICSRLPLELQMVISNRVFGSGKDAILSRDSEAGFKWVARS